MASESDIELNELDLDTTISPLVGEDEAPSVSKSDVSTVVIKPGFEWLSCMKFTVLKCIIYL